MKKHLKSPHAHLILGYGDLMQIHSVGAGLCLAQPPIPHLEVLCHFFQPPLRTCSQRLPWDPLATCYLRFRQNLQMFGKCLKPSRGTSGVHINSQGRFGAVAAGWLCAGCQDRHVWEIIFEERLWRICRNARLITVETHLRSVTLLLETQGKLEYQPCF